MISGRPVTGMGEEKMLKIAAVFSDHMVLQRNKKICVFGEGTEGSKITITLGNDKAFGRCRDGKWTVYLLPRKAQEGLTMEITDGQELVRFTDVAVGEVWLAGGQSNMELELKDADEGQEILKQGIKEAVRFYYTPKQSYIGESFEMEERKSHWELFNEKDAAKWSAVGFFYARELARKLESPDGKVTIGIIGCNWGGTSASCWMSRDSILAYKTTRSYVEEFESSPLIAKPMEEQIREYQEYLRYQEEWDKKAAAVYEKEPMIAFDKIQELIGPCGYPGPMNYANFTRPAGLYETMIQRVAPYTLRGFIYYQGESDEHKPESYYDLFTGLIGQWRQDWGDDTLPFLMVQLPMHRYQHDPDTKSWCIIRESQMRTFHTLKNTGIAVAIDCGQFHEIHPKNKRPVGERLALQALSGVYHLISDEEAFGPVYRDFLYRDGGMEIVFDYAKEGFVCSREKPTGFELAGDDGIFRGAEAVFEKDKIFLRSDEVSEPVMARYLWTNYGEVTVFGANGLPMAPFRTHIFH